MTPYPYDDSWRILEVPIAWSRKVSEGLWRLIIDPAKDRIPKSPVLSESAPCRSLVSAAEMQLIPCEDWFHSEVVDLAQGQNLVMVQNECSSKTISIIINLYHSYLWTCMDIYIHLWSIFIYIIFWVVLATSPLVYGAPGQDCGRRFNPASLEKHRAAGWLKQRMWWAGDFAKNRGVHHE